MALTEAATGTLTFVFTDIEGSTRLLRTLGADYPRALRRHNDIIIAAAAAEEGRAFGSEGDAQSLVFGDAVAAVRAAVAIQRALAAEPWPQEQPVRVRIGIHSGTARLDQTGYTGMVLHETARISAAGHGGQVLLSPTTAALVTGALPDGISLRDLGEHRFKDLEEPLRIAQLVIDRLPTDFPPLRAGGTPRARLPEQLTTFIDRGEIEALVRLSEQARLLTLTGPGGTGKTRLAIAVAERVSHRFTDGTWFVPLDAVTEPDVLPSEIVTTLGVSAGSDAPLERLTSHLRERHVLLVLDNLEQIIDAGTAIAWIIRECPGVAVIATSRIPLRVYGEQEYPVPALSVPPRSSDVTAARMRQFESVRLFEERARAAKPSFELTDENAALAADIVAGLDGLPLAIELAAARLRMLPLPALQRRLDDRLGTLSGGGVDRPGRQQTLRGAIAWSHDLLDDPDRCLFARMGIIAGSAGLSRIEAIVGPAQEIGRDVFDGLESLTQQSLLRVIESDDDEPRFGMLATIREYAREQLVRRGEHGDLQRRHAAAYLAFAEEASPNVTGPEAASWCDRLERDHDDLRAALDWTVAHDEAELGMRLIVALWRFWQVRGHLFEARERTASVLAMPSAASQPAALRSRAEGAAGGICYWLSQAAETYQHYDAALELALGSGDRALIAESHYNLAFAPYAERSAQAEDSRAMVADHLGEALRLYRELGDRAGIARTSWSLAIYAGADDRIDEARRLAQESLAAARAEGDQYQVGWSLHTLGQADIAAGDLEEARRHILESFETWVTAGDVSGLTLLLLDAAIVARARGSEACSWQLIGAEERMRTETGTNLGAYTVEFKGIDIRREPESEQEAGWVEAGRQLSLDETIELVRGAALGA